MLFWDEDVFNILLEEKMLFIDPSEVRDESKLVLGNLDYALVPGLEERTGADLMVSAIKAPASSEALIRYHLKHKAVLVQRKHRLDLVGSLDERLKTSIYKMRQFGAHQSQCALLFVGVLTCDREGQAVIDGQTTHRGYWSVYAGMEVWLKYGGVIEPPLSRASLFPDWVKFKVHHIAECLELPVKEFIPLPDRVYEVEPDDPVQELVLVKDWRATAMCCPKWGIKRINQLRELMLDYNEADTLMAAIAIMTSSRALAISGVGMAMVRAARRWVGLPDDMDPHFEVHYNHVSDKEVSIGKK